MKSMRPLWSTEPMLSHQSVSDSLPAYSDGTLPTSRRSEVETHLRTCARCAETLWQSQRLDLVLRDLPSPPFAPFPRFWSKLRERLPPKVEERHPVWRPRRVAAGFAVAVLVSLVGVTALASDGTMPDSPLYQVKRFRQEVQLAVAAPRQRPRLELALSKQRLHEAVVMVQRQRPDLALASLKHAHALIVDASLRLEGASGSQPDSAELAGSVAELKLALADAREATLAQAGGDGDDLAAVDRAISEDLNAVNQLETEINTGGSRVVESPSPEPAPSPESSAAPKSSPSPEPNDVASPEAPPASPATAANTGGSRVVESPSPEPSPSPESSAAPESSPSPEPNDVASPEAPPASPATDATGPSPADEPTP